MKKYGLIGFPLGHSFSKKYFTEKFKKENIDNCQFDLYSIEKVEELLCIVKENEEIKGMSVTIPHKESVINLLDELDETAEFIGAVNSIKISTRNNKPYLKGFNTDCYGFEMALRPSLTNLHKKALILGTGGAAKAVEYTLKKLGIETVYVSRTPKSGEKNYNDLNEDILREFKLIVNTTPLGMSPKIETKPNIKYQYLTHDHLLFDLVYNPIETTFMKEGKKHGATVLNGLEMLHSQAEKSWKIWND